MAAPLQSPYAAGRAVPRISLIRTAVGLFIVALTACFLPSGPPPAGPAIWATVAVGAFVLSIVSAIAAEARKHRFIRTAFGYCALAFLVLSAAIMAAASVAFSPGTQMPVTPDVFIFAGTIALTAAAVLGILAGFRAERAVTRFLPTTPLGWWAAAFLAVGEVLQYSPWAALSPAIAMSGPALALAAMFSYRERSVLSVVALVAGPAQLAYFYLAFFISLFTPHP
jgi:hypothetical protein